MKDTRDVIGLNVFSVEEGRILGRTVECVVDLAGGKVLGLVVEGPGGEQMGIARGDITSVGRDAVMVGTAAVLKPLAEIPEIDNHRMGGPEPPSILTRSGEVLGALGTVRVDEACEKVEGYEVVIDVMQAITDGPASLPIVEGTVHGRDAVILPDGATASVTRPGGVRQRLEKAYDSVVEAATGVGQKMTAVAKKATEVAEEKGKSALDAVGETAKSARAAVEVKVEAAKEKGAAKKAPPKKKAAKKKKAPAKKKGAKKKAPAKKAPAKSEGD